MRARARAFFPARKWWRSKAKQFEDGWRRGGGGGGFGGFVDGSSIEILARSVRESKSSDERAESL
ncbi:hypothetical protein MCX37_14870 [Vibrio aestuarianus]|uniref:hypothetical protein n=1 Tax=Vibrio aestuarianus TaxID=28171 RepID=UPI00237CC5A1|nr:hypothetical protein [Vibrio aestuarianus]MDE1218392.1 hypothetical protein [Vibrio aestuarianus]